MNEQTCGNCAHFRLHYIRRGRRYFSLRYGHCVCPRLKKRGRPNGLPVLEIRRRGAAYFRLIKKHAGTVASARAPAEGYTRLMGR